MKNFIFEYIAYVNKHAQIKYPKLRIKIIDIDNIRNFKYLKDESPLHNSVVLLNKKLIKKIPRESSILEIGCGTDSIFFKSKKKIFSRLDGLDVHEKDFRGRKTLANLIGSVSDLPLRSNFYDYCISNQSIEHWFEYEVNLNEGISEISRILKKDTGKIVLNFPLFLHGKKEFVQGNIEYILSIMSKFFNLKSITFVYSGSQKYMGWERCNQSKKRVKGFILKKGINSIPYSFVCEIEGTKNNLNKVTKNKIFPKFSRFLNIYKDYGLIEIFFKLISKFKKVL